jgi:hypothetical protein
LLRRVLEIGCVLAALAVVAARLGGQSGPTADFVVLKVEDLSSSGVHLAIITTNTRADADAVRRQLESGAAFDRVAAERSKHPTAAVGGDFGVFPLTDLRPEFRAGIDGVKPGGYTQVISLDRSASPPGWPEALPAPGTSQRSVELALGRGYTSATLHADGQSTMTELTYAFGAQLRIHETRGLGFMELTSPWKSTIFGINLDDQIPQSLYDLFPPTGRFIRGVFVGVPGHPNWFIDVDDRVDAVRRVLFVDRGIYGDLPGVPKSP